MNYSLKNFEIPSYNTSILYTNYNYNEDAAFYLNNKCTVVSLDTLSNITDIPDNILEDFNVLYLKTKKDLTTIDNLIINILNSIISSNSTIVFLNVLTYVDKAFRKKIFAYLKSNNKQIINYTTDPEEVLFLDYLIVMQQSKVIIEGKTKLVLKEEKIIKRLGFNLPFIIELSSGLKYYKVIDKLYFDSESLVNKLWK
mgnify:CR=1 FL=1